MQHENGQKRGLCDNQEFNLLDSVKHVVQNIQQFTANPTVIFYTAGIIFKDERRSLLLGAL